MQPITKISSQAIAIDMDNIDTDQIIPARYLKVTSKNNMGQYLFRDWRFDTNGNQNNNCELNHCMPHKQILVAGRNFGCGSSREHAAWALYDYGFRAILSVQFADIFHQNALSTGILPIKTPQSFIDAFKKETVTNPQTKIKIDLENQWCGLNDQDVGFCFQINPYRKECLMHGLDDIDYLLQQRENILAYETKRDIYQ